MKISPLRITISAAVWFLLMCGLALFYFWQWLHNDHWVAEAKRYFLVEKGESVQSVAQRLHQQDLLRWPRAWGLYVRFLQPQPIRAGEYRLAERESPLSLLIRLQSGAVITYRVTLVEGRSFAEWVDVLAQQPKLLAGLAGKSQAEQLALLKLPINHPEGWFYPDTYQYVAGDSDVAILQRAYANMHQLLEREWQGRADGLPYKAPYEALIMASIIEKETGMPAERPEIAGVFVRRLQAGMRLQTDPTIIYGLGSAFDGNLRRQHLTQPNPYNSYLNAGLPPTPIAMPGKAAIRAALHPLPGDTLYFVGKGDGSHHFSSTLEEHNKAVMRYQRSVDPSLYHSSPKPTSVTAP